MLLALPVATLFFSSIAFAQGADCSGAVLDSFVSQYCGGDRASIEACSLNSDQGTMEMTVNQHCKKVAVNDYISPDNGWTVSSVTAGANSTGSTVTLTQNQHDED